MKLHGSQEKTTTDEARGQRKNPALSQGPQVGGDVAGFGGRRFPARAYGSAADGSGGERIQRITFSGVFGRFPVIYGSSPDAPGTAPTVPPPPPRREYDGTRRSRSAASGLTPRAGSPPTRGLAAASVRCRALWQPAAQTSNRNAAAAMCGRQLCKAELLTKASWPR